MWSCLVSSKGSLDILTTVEIGVVETRMGLLTFLEKGEVIMENDAHAMRSVSQSVATFCTSGSDAVTGAVPVAAGAKREEMC